MVGINTSRLPAQLVWEMVMGYSQCGQEQPSISSGLAVWRSASYSKSSAAKMGSENSGTQLSATAE